MFHGCPLGGDLKLTLGSDYINSDSSLRLSAGGFCSTNVYNNMELDLVSKVAFSGNWNGNYISANGLPYAKVSTKINYVGQGFIDSFSYTGIPCKDGVTYQINSDENFNLNLIGCTAFDSVGRDASVNFAPGLKVNLPDVTSCSYFLYEADRCTGPIYLRIGPKCTKLNNSFYYCTTPSILRYTEDQPVIDGSSLNNINGAFSRMSKLVDFEGIVNLGKAFTQKTTNYSYYTLDLSYSTLLSVESLRSIINNLYDLNQNATYVAAGTIYRQSLKLGATNLAKLTDEEKAIATNKGWELK
jgi:hypothetical protein